MVNSNGDRTQCPRIGAVKRLSEPVPPRFLPEPVSRLPLSPRFRRSQNRTLESRAWMMWMKLRIIGWKSSAYDNSRPVQACRSGPVVWFLERLDDFHCAQSSRSGSKDPPRNRCFCLLPGDRVTRQQTVLLHDCVQLLEGETTIVVLWRKGQSARIGCRDGICPLRLSMCAAALFPQPSRPLLFIAPFAGE